MLFFAFLFVACQPSEKELLLENAKKYLPSDEERALVIAEVEEGNEDFDAAYNAPKIHTPANSNHYHSKRVGMDNHPTRTAAQYAVSLLETGIPKNQERALLVIDAILAAQDVDHNSETYGIWSYYFEEPLEQMNKPDWNWADFISVQLLEAYLRYDDVIPVELQQKMEKSIIHASHSIKKRDVKPSYTNIAIMGTLVTHLAGHLFDNQELKDYADMRMERFYDYTKELGGFVEYNSPTYTKVALDELVRMKQYVIDTTTLEMVDYCYNIGWKVLSDHFHASAGQLTGPHSRSYSTLLRSSFYDFLYGASDAKVKIGSANGPTDYYKLQHKIPDDLLTNFIETPIENVVIDTFDLEDNPPIGYSYITPQFSFGSVNRCTTWQQRRPYLAYWGNQDEVGFLRIKLMHDGEDFGIGNIFTVQNKNEALTAMNFAINGGDYHISIDRIQDGKFSAKDVRFRFEMALTGSGEIQLDDNGFSIEDMQIQINVNMLKSVFGDEQIKMEKGGEGELSWVDYIIYVGEEKEFDLSKFNEACFAWQTLINSDVTTLATIEQSDAQLTVLGDGLSLSIPTKPALEADLQSTFTIKN